MFQSKEVLLGSLQLYFISQRLLRKCKHTMNQVCIENALRFELLKSDLLYGLYMYSNSWKTVLILIRWLLQKPADLDL